VRDLSSLNLNPNGEHADEVHAGKTRVAEAHEILPDDPAAHRPAARDDVGVAELTPLCWGPWSNVRCARNRPVPGIIWMLWRKETLTGGDDPIRACR